MLRRLFFILLVCLFSVKAFAISEEALKNLAQLIYDSFPPVEGFVVGVSGDKAVIDLGAKNKVYKGMVLSISRKGLPFRHPITGQIIGYTERELGLMQVVKVYPSASIGRIYASEPVKPGDIVRITRAKINLYIFPLSDKTGGGFNLIAFSDRLRRFLEETGRFRIFTEERVIQEVSAYGGDTTDLGLLKAIHTLYKNKKEPYFALLGWIDKEGDSYFFRGSLICLNIAKRVRAFSVYIGKAGWRPSAERGVLFVSSLFDGKADALASGDIDGDGKREIIFNVVNKLLVYTYNPEKRNLIRRDGFDFSPTYKVFSLDMADLDGDGRDELVMAGSDFKDFTPISFIYKWTAKGWKRIKRVEGSLLRAIKLDGNVFIFSQYISPQDPFSEPPKLVRYDNGRLKTVDKIKALKGDLILGMDLLKDENGEIDFVVNEEGRVVVKNRNGEVVADVPGYYGNTGVAFFYKEPMVKVFYEGEGFLEISKQDYMRFKELTLTVPGRSLVCRSKDGLKLIVYRNNPFMWEAYFEPFKGAVLKMYRWKEGFFEDTGWIKSFSEGIRDIYLSDVDGDGKNEVLVLVIKGIRTRKEGLKFNSRIVIYRISK
ncbi:MAG: VCBS repeat-containing protein [Deferribacteres bacterium]|nr:VCBS repeat-containing protein [Deferribacteres bacterium]